MRRKTISAAELQASLKALLREIARDLIMMVGPPGDLTETDQEVVFEMSHKLTRIGTLLAGMTLARGTARTAEAGAVWTEDEERIGFQDREWDRQRAPYDAAPKKGRAA